MRAICHSTGPTCSGLSRCSTRYAVDRSVRRLSYITYCSQLHTSGDSSRPSPLTKTAVRFDGLANQLEETLDVIPPRSTFHTCLQHVIKADTLHFLSCPITSILILL